jgi:RNA polymerase sigma-70 factor, ECF subfamily
VCVRAARRHVRSDEDAQDVAQDALIRAWRARHTCTDPTAPWAWLAAIARNEALRARAQRRPVPAQEAEQLVDEAAPPCGDHDALDAAIDLRRALTGVQRRDRLLLLLHYEADLTQARAAELLGIPEGTVKVRLHRLRSQLRKRLTS